MRRGVFPASNEPELVLLPGDIVMFSWSVSVPGKARLAGNGRCPCQEVQRCPGALTDQPEGRSRDARGPRCRACQGRRPLPAHGALPTSITRTLNTTISPGRSTSLLTVAGTAAGCRAASLGVRIVDIRRSGRAAEGAPLLRAYTLIAYRGFESLLLRHCAIAPQGVRLNNNVIKRSYQRHIAQLSPRTGSSGLAFEPAPVDSTPP